jgi:hypothetical protein
MSLKTLNIGALANPEMERTSAKKVTPLRHVLRASVLVEVGISGLLFFGSFLLEGQKK